jgi:hypothetical protein
VYNGKKELASLLLKNKAAVDAKTEDGNTPLHYGPAPDYFLPLIF